MKKLAILAGLAAIALTGGTAILMIGGASGQASCWITVCVMDTACAEFEWWDGLEARIVCGDPTEQLYQTHFQNCQSWPVPQDVLQCWKTYGIKIYGWDDACSPSRVTTVVEYTPQEIEECSGTLLAEPCVLKEGLNCD